HESSEPRALSGVGQGPIDAFVAALQAQTSEQISVLDYHEHAVGAGADARAAAYIELRVGKRTLFGVGVDRSILTASFNAVLPGLRRAHAAEAAAALAVHHA